MENGFFLRHGLGDDYIVMDPNDLTFELTPERRIQWGVTSPSATCRDRPPCLSC